MKRIIILLITFGYSHSLQAMDEPMNTDIVKLWALPPVDRPAKEGYTFHFQHDLHTVVSSGTLDHLRHLLDQRTHTTVNAQDENGDTPLHLAAQENDWQKGSLLLRYGAKASIDITNDQDETPFECLIEDQDPADVLKYLCGPRCVFAYILEAASEDKQWEVEILDIPSVYDVYNAMNTMFVDGENEDDC